MKVCFISPLGYGLYDRHSGYPFGGAEVQFFLLARALASDPEFQVTVLTTVRENPGSERHGPLTVVKRRGGDRLANGSLRGYASAFLEMRRALRDIGAAVYLHAGAGVEVGAYALICRLLRRRFIFVVASSADLRKPNGQVQGPLAWLYPLGVRLADAVVCRTDEQLEWLRTHYGREGVLIRSGHCIPQRIPEAQARLEKTTILWVGRMHPLKQPGMFLDLAERLPKERYVMVIMHDPAHEDLARAVGTRAAALGNMTVYEDIPFNGMEKFFERAKLLVNTSTYEGFPNTFVQAAMHGTPILSWTVDPDGILARHGIGICAEGSYDSLVVSAARVCASESPRAEMGKRAAEYAREHHDVNRSAEALKAVVRTFTGRRVAGVSEGRTRKTLRLCFVGPAASVTTRRWVEWFARRGHNTTVITVEPAETPSFRQIDVSSPAWPRKLGRVVSALRLALAVRRLKPDVVHVHYARGLAWGLLLARFHPYVVFPWGSDVLDEQGAFREWYSKRLTCALLGGAELITVPSEYLETRIRALLPMAPAMARIAPGINLKEFRSGLDVRSLRERWRIGKDARVIFSPRLAQPFYNLDRIIGALPAVRRKVPETMLVVTEHSPDQEYVASLRQLVADLGVADCVRFVGAIPYPDMPLWYNLADAVVMVPRSDGLPNSLVEVMACGAVPVLNRLPQYAELVSHGANGILVDLEQGDLVGALVGVLSDPGLKAHIARTNRAKVIEMADQDREMARMEGWYIRLAAQRQR